MTNSIEVSEIVKSFGTLTAVKGVSFDVKEGEFFGFLGPNGAGKTTLIRMLTTLLKPTSGTAKVAGLDVVENPREVRKNIGVVPQAMTSDLDLTGIENMDIYGKFYEIPKRERKDRISYLLDIVGLSQRGNDLVASYSGGMRRRLEIAKALMHRPKILFLDEPTIGLDPQSRHVIWELLRKLRAEDPSITIFLTTHYMEEAEVLSDRVAIIDSGSIIAIGTTKQLKTDLPGNDIITISFSNLSETLAEALKERIGGLSFVHKIQKEDSTLRVYVDNGAKNLPTLLDEIKSQGGQVSSVGIHEQSLEDVFIHYTGKSIREEEVKKVSLFIGAGVPRKWGR